MGFPSCAIRWPLPLPGVPRADALDAWRGQAKPGTIQKATGISLKIFWRFQTFFIPLPPVSKLLAKGCSLIGGLRLDP